ncbi:MAG: hypothetical protein JWM95_579 [Gemmatimonadetes bacterium]|nr:hypothetical protein [Gemmatimonadota bacterium]
MTSVGSILLGVPVVLVMYTYALYPLMLWVMAMGRSPADAPERQTPLVSIVLPAYNEEVQIRGAIEALLAQDYPAECLQILVLSDASTDKTDEIVREYSDRGVELLRMSTRSGKTAAENASCALLRGEIVINTDSSVRLHPAAVGRLVQAMADPSIGVASTSDVSVSRDSATANTAEAGYVGYEMRIRELETLTGGIVGASGSGYAIRESLHRLPVRADLSRDFSAALTARTHGYRSVSVNDALCYVPRTTSLKAEYRRKVRTMARGMETLLHNQRLLDPSEFGSFSWKLFSHKICRWLVPASVVVGSVGLTVMATHHAWAAGILGCVVLVLLLAAIGARWPSSRRLPRFLSLVSFSVAANLAVLHAILRVLLGYDDHLWEPTRRSASIPHL